MVVVKGMSEKKYKKLRQAFREAGYDYQTISYTELPNGQIIANQERRNYQKAKRELIDETRR